MQSFLINLFSILVLTISCWHPVGRVGVMPIRATMEEGKLPYYEPDGSEDDIVLHFAKVSVDM